MNKLKEELEYRIGVLRSLGNTITLKQIKELDILKEYLAFVEKVEKEIDKTQFEGWYKEKVDLKERIFNGKNN